MVDFQHGSPGRIGQEETIVPHLSGDAHCEMLAPPCSHGRGPVDLKGNVFNRHRHSLTKR